MAPDLRFFYGHPTQFGEPFFRYLASSGVAIDVVYARRPGSVTDGEIGRAPSWLSAAGHGYPHRYLADTGFLTLRRVLIDRAGLTVLPGWGEPWARTAFFAAKAARARVLLHIDSSFADDVRRSASKRLARRAFLHAAHSIGVVGANAHRYAVNYGVSPNRIVLFPYTTDALQIAATADEAAAQIGSLRAELGFHSRDRVVIAVTKLAQREDPHTLLNGFALALASQPELRLLLVGDGPLRWEVERRVAALGLQHAVAMPGYVEYTRLAAFYAASNVFVHTARVEPWGVSVVEAMAAGLPVVLADSVGASLDAVVPGRGWTFAAGDASSLGDRLASLGTSEDLVAMGLRARDWAVDYCDFAAIKSRLLAVASPER